MPLKIGVIGGSIAGCAAAIQLRRLGHDVIILERSSHQLISRGAGIVLPQSLIDQCIELDLFDADIPRLPATSRSFYIKDPEFFNHGKKIWQQDFNAVAFNWSDIYFNLRKRISDEHYHSGAEVGMVHETHDTCQIETKQGEKYQFDLVIAADGFDSFIRQKIFPDLKPSKVGYVAWRGITTMPDSIAKDFFTAQALYYVFPQGHLLLYCIPAPDYSRTGRILLNWLLYENSVENAESVPPGKLTPQQISHLHHVAQQALPAGIADIICGTEAPFLQAIYDLQVPQYVKNRICFIGDAATILRPHTASGVLKAMTDSISLAAALDKKYEWSESQHKLAQQQMALTKVLGAALVTNQPNWQTMNQQLMDEWWQHVISGKNWYATSLITNRH